MGWQSLSRMHTMHWLLKPADIQAPHSRRDCVGFVAVGGGGPSPRFDHLS